MRKSEITIGATYAVKVSGKIVPVRITGVSVHGGWYGENHVTGREVRVRSAQRCRYELVEVDGRWERRQDVDGRKVSPHLRTQYDGEQPREVREERATYGEKEKEMARKSPLTLRRDEVRQAIRASLEEHLEEVLSKFFGRIRSQDLACALCGDLMPLATAAPVFSIEHDQSHRVDRLTLWIEAMDITCTESMAPGWTELLRNDYRSTRLCPSCIPDRAREQLDKKEEE